MAWGGIILCGGKSRRMGRSKAWLPCGEETLLQRVCRLVAAQVDIAVVVAADQQDLPPLPTAIEIVRDAAPDEGPLRGLATGMAALRGRCEWVYVTACDAPFLPAGFIGHLAAWADGHEAAVPNIDGRSHPLTACYHLRTLDHCLRLLEQGRRRMLDLLQAIRVRWVPTEELAAIDPHGNVLQNVNTPEEYTVLLRQRDLS